MILDSIELTNFRCFEHLKLENLHEHLNVFVGENGTGKTSLLEGIRLCLGTYIGQFSDVDTSEKQRFYIKPEDVRFTGYGEFAEITSFSCKVVLNGKSYTWRREKEGRNGKTTSKKTDIGEIEGLVTELEKNIKHPANGPMTDLPLVAYFSADRVSGDRKFQQKDKLFTSRVRGYFNSLGDFTNIEYLKAWFRDRQLAKFQHPKQFEPGLELMQKVIKKIPGVTGIEYIMSPSDSSAESDLYLTFDTGKRVGFDYLSYGTKMFVSVLADIAMRCILLNPSKGANANETAGIILIDEVDLNLHPAWQRKVVHALTEAFPEIQFIITTHSPQVVSGVPKDNLFILKDFKAERGSVFTEGRDSNSLLQDVFDVPKRPYEEQQMLNRFYEYLEAKNQKEALVKLEELEKLWGELDSEIVRANLYYQDLLDEIHS